MADVPSRVVELIETFDRNIEAYRSQQYNEAQLRREFIDPFFEELGWDITNKAGHAQAYKDVIHEDAIKIGGHTKAPDYCFRVGGTRKFFLEAKKPSVDIKADVHPAYQLRRYAWSAKLPLSILTDFEEFAVYDCQIRPRHTDKASAARIKYLTYKEYINKWHEIVDIFSKDAILKGSFDKFAVSTKGKRGTTPVDIAFLEEIEKWRKGLAQTIAHNNRSLSKNEINFAVQRTIDRILFLRMCEDRGIEPYKQLDSLTNGKGVYPRLCELFERADKKYNSGLFHFQHEKGRAEPPDELTLNLVVEDPILKLTLSNLYYPQCPYEFYVIPPEILGNVYEQFLGRVVTVSPARRVSIDEKPEVKKAGGVYYTPAYIVDYIVKNTVGKLSEGKTPKDISKLKILDPACGSGSFLLGAYTYLLNYNRDWYVENNPEKYTKQIYQGKGGHWFLTIAEKKKILLNNIFGVDIDSQAVEVTKLSLLLKVLEGESKETVGQIYTMFHERALPDLANNIKCGNSLIGPDFYKDKAPDSIDEEQRRRMNAFNWKAEFPQIFKRKKTGFDVIIGNPPWGAVFTDQELQYHRNRNQEIIVRMIDSFMYFVYQSSKKLNSDGFLGMIVPDVLLYQSDNLKLREFILRNFKIHSLLNMGDVFHKVTRPASILIIQQAIPSKHVIAVSDFSKLSKQDKESAIFKASQFERLSQAKLETIPRKLFITSHSEEYQILSKIKTVSHKSLQDFVDQDGIQRGVSPDLKQAFVIDSKTVHKFNLEKPKLRPVLTGGKQVGRYFIEYPDLWLIYTTRDDDFSLLPNICLYIDQFKDSITCKEVKQQKHPLYSLHRPRKESIFIKDKKLIGVITGDRIAIARDDRKTFVTDGLYLFAISVQIDQRYILAILNSKLFVFIYRLLALETGRVLAQVKPTILSQLPIRTIDFSNLSDKAKHDKMLKLVDRMLDLHQKLAAAQVPDEKTRIERQISTTDSTIDKLVYDLYDITEEEIAIVEGQGK